jgi:hypothetical protein
MPLIYISFPDVPPFQTASNTVSNSKLYISGLLGGLDGLHEICKAGQ